METAKPMRLIPQAKHIRQAKRFGLTVVALVLAVTLVCLLVDRQTFRWASSRILYTAFVVAGPWDEQPRISFGPSSTVPARSFEASRLSDLFEDFEVTVISSDPEEVAAWNLSFLHEDLRTPEVKKFRSEAMDILDTEDLFELSDRLRSLTRHGKLANPPGETDPLEYLNLARGGTPLTCRHFAVAYGGLCVAKGYTSRLLALRRLGNDACHAVCEVYMPRYGKWVLVDPDFNVAYRSAGQWLDARQLQQAWMKVKRMLGRSNLTFEEIDQYLLREKPPIGEWTGVEMVVLGDAGEPLRRTNLYQTSSTAMNLEFFEYVLYTARNDYRSGRYPYGHPARWIEYILRADPDADWSNICPEGFDVKTSAELYGPVGRTSILAEGLLPNSSRTLQCRLETWTPNFECFEACFDEGGWERTDRSKLSWPLHDGRNLLKARSVNLAGLRGEPARLEIVLEPRKKDQTRSEVRVQGRTSS